MQSNAACVEQQPGEGPADAEPAISPTAYIPHTQTLFIPLLLQMQDHSGIEAKPSQALHRQCIHVWTATKICVNFVLRPLDKGYIVEHLMFPEDDGC